VLFFSIPFYPKIAVEDPNSMCYLVLNENKHLLEVIFGAISLWTPPLSSTPGAFTRATAPFSQGFYIFAILTVATHPIAILRMPPTYLPWESSFTNTFAIFAELALHVGLPRCLQVIKPTRNDLLTPNPFLSTLLLPLSFPNSLSHFLLRRSAARHPLPRPSRARVLGLVHVSL